MSQEQGKEFQVTFQDEITPHYLCVLNAFLRAVNAFNARRFEELESLLDANASAGTIKPQGDIEQASGKRNVIVFLRNKVSQANDVPLFTPLPPISVGIDAGTGTVTGSAIWKDQQPDKRITARRIAYKFTFSLIGGCPILTLYASPDE